MKNDGSLFGVIRPVVSFVILIFNFILNESISAQDTQTKDLFNWEDSVGAKEIPPSNHIFWVNDYGIGNKTDLVINTKAIQAAIDDCSTNGGGIVSFKPGVYLTGAIFLKNNVNLRIDKGVEIWGVQDLNFYPEMDSRIAGIEMRWPSAIINVIGKRNVAISGGGIINAQGRYLWEKYWNMRTEYVKKNLRWIVDYDCKRVRTILVSDSKQVSINDLTIKQAGFWSLHLLYSENVTVDGVVIRNNIEGMGPSTDGIDVDSSSKILIQNCDVDCHDDNYCLKAGRDADGLRVNRPTEYIIIRNCISRTGAGLITIGSETSGSIRNVHAYNLKAYGTSAGIKLKSALTRGGTVEDIYVNDIEMDSVETAISIGVNWNPSYSYSSLPKGYQLNNVPIHWQVMLKKVEPKQKGIPTFRNINIENVKATNVNVGISAHGTEDTILDSFVLKNMDINCKSYGGVTYASNWIVENVVLKDVDGVKDKFIFNHCKKVDAISLK